MRRSWTFSRKLALGFTVIVVVFASVAFTGLRTTQSLAAYAERVAHTQEVRAQLARLLAGLVDAETSERGFVITGADRFLDPYSGALASLDTAFTALRRLTADNPNQQRRLDDLRPLIEQRRGDLEGVIEARRTGGLEAGAARMSRARSEELSGAIRRLLGEMETEERALLDARERSAGAAEDTAALVIQGGGALAVVIAIATGWLLSRSLVQHIGSAALQVQTSSAELQSAANQQVSAARDQVTAMGQVGSSRVDLQACKLEYSIVSPK